MAKLTKKGSKQGFHSPQMTHLNNKIGTNEVQFPLRMEARNGRLLFWKRVVLHLYSSTIFFLGRSLLSILLRVNRDCSLLTFFCANLRQIVCRLLSRVSVLNTAHASEYRTYLLPRIILNANFWIDSISEVCLRVILECQTGAAYSNMDRTSLA